MQGKKETGRFPEEILKISELSQFYINLLFLYLFIFMLDEVKSLSIKGFKTLKFIVTTVYQEEH